MEQKSALSKESKDFLNDLSVYLFSSGKKMNEVDEIVEELRTHLHEAEKQGKSIEHIIGTSPKSYMESISNEMEMDYHTWIKYIILIIFGSFSFIIFQDLIHGTLIYSVMEIIGHIVIAGLFIGVVFLGFRFLSTSELALKAQAAVFFVIGIFPIGLFVGLIYLDRSIATPVIDFGVLGSIIIGVLTVLFVICISVWAKTWMFCIVLCLLVGPEVLLGITNVSYESQLIWSTLITFVGFAVYFLILSKMDNKKV